MTEGSLFVPDGDRWVPTELARGPWTPDALHGGPVAALVTRAAELCEPAPHMHVARLTLELIRPVPVAPLEVRATMARPGRKVQLVDVQMSSEGVVLASGRVLRIRTLEGDEEVERQIGDAVNSARQSYPSAAPLPGPEDGRWSPPISEGYVAFHNAGAELRFVRGEFGARGPAAVWVRLAVPVVEGEVPSPSQRATSVADFGNGVSSVLDFDKWVFINPDLTVFLERPPFGEWVCLDASTRLGVAGTGLAQCELSDVTGPIGRSVQSLLVEPR